MKAVDLKNGIDIAIDTPEGDRYIMHDVVIQWVMSLFQNQSAIDIPHCKYSKTKDNGNELRLTIYADKVTKI